jgi:hypothetical protein
LLPAPTQTLNAPPVGE